MVVKCYCPVASFFGSEKVSFKMFLHFSILFHISLLCFRGDIIDLIGNVSATSLRRLVEIDPTLLSKTLLDRIDREKTFTTRFTEESDDCFG